MSARSTLLLLRPGEEEELRRLEEAQASTRGVLVCDNCGQNPCACANVDETLQSIDGKLQLRTGKETLVVTRSRSSSSSSSSEEELERGDESEAVAPSSPSDPHATGFHWLRADLTEAPHRGSSATPPEPASMSLSSSPSVTARRPMPPRYTSRPQRTRDDFVWLGQDTSQQHPRRSHASHASNTSEARAAPSNTRIAVNDGTLDESLHTSVCRECGRFQDAHRSRQHTFQPCESLQEASKARRFFKSRHPVPSEPL